LGAPVFAGSAEFAQVSVFHPVVHPTPVGALLHDVCAHVAVQQFRQCLRTGAERTQVDALSILHHPFGLSLSNLARRFDRPV